jgi:hypothetical protein
VCRHGTLGRKATENAHCVNEVPQKGIRDNLIDSFVKRIKCQGQIQKHIWVRHNKGQTASRGGKKASVLSKI